MSKADLVRERLGEIAAYRMDGTTWPTIAIYLSTSGLPVTGDEIRAYWGRYSEGKHPAEFLIEQSTARAMEAERRLADAEDKIKKLEADLAAWTAIGVRIATAHRAESNEGMMAEILSISAWYDRVHSIRKE